MKIPQARCDDAQLIALINDGLSGERLESMLLHIEECDRCRMRMEELSADSHQWQKTVKVLSDIQSDVRHSQPSSIGQVLAQEFPLLSPKESFNPNDSELLVKQLLAPPSHPEMLGRLGRYEVERLIGSGGMGVVFKAFDTELNRPVAIKVLAPHLANCGSARQRFAREARAAAAVVNEHVVPIHNVETEVATPFLVMKYIDGESLQSRLDREGPLEVDEILRIGMQVAAGLAAAHEQGLVHRDIKPANILLEQGLERALITDFGLARAVDDAHLTQSGFHAGTPQYMSPEQVSGHAVACSSDLFSLGSVLYAMCTGRPPFRSENSFGVLKRIAEDTPRSIREVNPRVPLWLECIVNKLLAKRVDQRPQSATLVNQLLAQSLKHVQNSLGAPLPNLAVEWMNEIKAAQSAANKKTVVGVFSAFTQKRYVVVGVLALIIVGLLLTTDRLPYFSGTARDTNAGGSAATDRDSSSSKFQPTISPQESVQNAPFDLDLEWDTAINAARSLQLEVDELERKLRQESSE